MTKSNLLTIASLTAIAVFSTTVVSSATVLFTTTEDFNLLTPSDPSSLPVANSTFDYDGSTTNGLANQAGSGNAGTGGSVLLSAGDASNYTQYTVRIDAYPALINDLKASTAVSLFYTAPTTPTSGNYFDLQIVFNFDNNFIAYGATSTQQVAGGILATYSFDAVLDTDPNMPGNQSRPFIPDAIANQQAGSGIGYFYFGVISNSNYKGSTLMVDNIQTIPEPSTVALAAVSVVGGLMMLRKRRVSH